MHKLVLKATFLLCTYLVLTTNVKAQLNPGDVGISLNFRYHVNNGQVKQREGGRRELNFNYVLNGGTFPVSQDIILKLNQRKLRCNVVAYGDRIVIRPWGLNNEDSTFNARETTENDFWNAVKDSTFILFQGGNLNRSVEQPVQLNYASWNLYSLLVPIKIRFSPRDSVPTSFSTGVNIGAVLGRTWGKTTFVYGRTPVSYSLTLGLFLGVQPWTINSNQLLNYRFAGGADSLASRYGSKELSVGLFTTGAVLMYTYRSFEVGVLLGYDFILDGRFNSKWIYYVENNRYRPWLGFGFGVKIDFFKRG